MADFICLAMASQYNESNTAESVNSNSFRRSLGTSTLFNRRSSRANNNDGSSVVSAVGIPNISEEQKSSIHIRIVPSIENPSRSLVFDIIERDLEVGRIIKIGRFTDRSSVQNHISFKSKVVSRSHCEIWLNAEGKVQLKDTRSSSGTFVNHVRLSPAATESRPFEIRDGDLIQLGVDYQGGYEEIYRSVKMRLEVNRDYQQNRTASYTMSAFNHLRSLTNVHHHHPTTTDQQQQQQQVISAPLCDNNTMEVEECCICLYALAPFQALFVAPCSHSYHFKCIRPLFDSYPGFQCPICRTYSDLDASVSIEAEEIIEKYGFLKSSKQSITKKVEEEQELIASIPPTNVILSSIIPPAPELPLSTTLVACATSLSGIISSPIDRNEQTVPQDSRDHRATTHTVDDVVSVASNSNSQHRPSFSNRNSTNNLVEKIKMAFSNERRKSPTKRRANSSSETSSDDDIDMPCFSSSSPPSSPRHNTLLQPILSRQSTQYNGLEEILEEQMASSSNYTTSMNH